MEVNKMNAIKKPVWPNARQGRTAPGAGEQRQREPGDEPPPSSAKGGGGVF